MKHFLACLALTSLTCHVAAMDTFSVESADFSETCEVKGLNQTPDGLRMFQVLYLSGYDDPSSFGQKVMHVALTLDQVQVLHQKRNAEHAFRKVRSFFSGLEKKTHLETVSNSKFKSIVAAQIAALNSES